MSTQREYLDVAVGETITLDGPVKVEFLDRVDGSRLGVASVRAGGELKLTGIESAVFAKVITGQDNLAVYGDDVANEPDAAKRDERYYGAGDPFAGLDVPFTDQ